MRKRLTAALVALSILGCATTAKASSTPPPSQAALAELRWQHKHGAISDKYWQRLGHCETHSNPFHHTLSYGGLTGAAISTWKAYGGMEFGLPWKVDVQTQYVIYNRISIFGYQTRDRYASLADRQANHPMFMQPVGVGGWGCAHRIPRPHNKPHYHAG